MLTVVLMVALGSCCPAMPTGEVLSMKYQGATRTYIVHTPPSYTGMEPMPLLLALHGMTMTAGDMQSRSGFDQVADREGFIVCYPDGINRMWNSDPTSPGSVNMPDDAGFLAALVDQLSRDYAIDNSKIYVTGMSNGGVMAYRLAGTMGDKLAGVAGVISTLPVGFNPYCTPPQPVPMVFILGTEDPVFPWDGGYDVFGNVCYQSVQEVVGFWVGINGAATEPVVEELQDNDPADGTRVLREVFTATGDAEPVVLYCIEGGGHTWPGSPSIPIESWAGVGKTCQDFDAAEEIWATFQAMDGAA